MLRMKKNSEWKKNRLCKSILKVISYLITKSSRKLTVKNLFKLRQNKIGHGTRIKFLRILSKNVSGRKGVFFKDFRSANLQDIVENDNMFLPGDKPDPDTITLTSSQEFLDHAHNKTVLLHDSSRLKVQSTPFNLLWCWQSPGSNGRRILTSSYKFGRQNVHLRSMALETDSRKRSISLL